MVGEGCRIMRETKTCSPSPGRQKQVRERTPQHWASLRGLAGRGKKAIKKQERLEAADTGKGQRKGSALEWFVDSAQGRGAGQLGQPWGCPVTFPKASATPADPVPGWVSPVSVTELRATLLPQTPQLLTVQTAPRRWRSEGSLLRCGYRGWEDKLENWSLSLGSELLRGSTMCIMSALCKNILVKCMLYEIHSLTQVIHHYRK